MQLALLPFELRLEHTFTISRESYKVQNTLILQLKDGELTGLGEASSNPYYGITVQKMMDDILLIRPLIENSGGLNPSDFWNLVSPYLKNNMFALCALDMAYTDLYAQKKGRKLYEYWGLDISKNPKTNYTIGIDTIEKMVEKLHEMPWPIYKIKLGTKDDIRIIQELRNHADAIFRVDANCAWSVQETINNSFELKKLGVEFIEQPLQADDWEGHKEVFLNSNLPIIADESCQIEADINKCNNHFHGVNVKLVKCGGLTPAKRMLIHAKKLNLKTMVGCMTESSVGISSIAHLLPLLDFVDMDGALLLSKDIAKGVSIKNGEIAYGEGNGIGVKLIKE